MNRLSVFSISSRADMVVSSVLTFELRRAQRLPFGTGDLPFPKSGLPLSAWRERIDAQSLPFEPSVHVPVQEVSRVWRSDGSSDVRRLGGPAVSEEAGDLQRRLSVGGHESSLRSAEIRIADALHELAEQPVLAALRFARPILARIEQHCDASVITHWTDGEQTEAQHPQQLVKLPSSRTERWTAVRNADVHVGCHSEAIDRLQHNVEVERELQLDDDGFLNTSLREYIAVANLALHFVSLRLKEALDRKIEIRLLHRRNSGECFATAHVPVPRRVQHERQQPREEDEQDVVAFVVEVSKERHHQRAAHDVRREMEQHRR